ncbi:MAG: fatty acyl-AMP ligase [Candidatus Sericytochromatia bacterium]|nr:fatty acyl-AMP ligase [Candidatus Tanganyikabacteria bacterium]
MQTATNCLLLGTPGPDWRDRLEAQTIAELLRRRADSDRVFTFLDDLGKPSAMSYGRVARMAARYARVMRERGIKPGDRVVVMLPTCPEYLFTFFGIILAGAIPVPVYPPFNPRQLVAFLGTLAGVFNNSQATAIVFWKDVKPIIGEALARAASVEHALSLEAFAGPEPETFDPPAIELSSEATAMIQYTSGSTDQPKGVELSHLNLLHNMDSVKRALRLVPGEDVVVSWLPLYHDMGLIGVMIGAVYSHIDMVLMGPQSFLMRPKMWLKAVSDYRGTITVAPNFAYNLCATRVPDSALAGLDLSCLRVAMCGAEPIRHESVEAFLARFKPLGFAREAFLPVYGLAESTLGSSFPPVGAAPAVRWLEREALEAEHVARPGDPAAGAVAAYGCGQPFPASQLRIVDAESGQILPEGGVGEIQLSGPSVMKGYFRNPQATSETLRDGWLRTGDLGFVQDGHVFISGRLKDLIIRNGRNYYPQDLEFVVEQLEGVRKGCVIAFGHMDLRKGTEEVVVLAESRQHAAEQCEALRSSIREALSAQLSLVPDTVEILPPHTLLKTSSGKLRRKPSKELYLAGELRPRRDSLLAQFRVIARSQLHWSKRRIKALFRA